MQWGNDRPTALIDDNRVLVAIDNPASRCVAADVHQRNFKCGKQDAIVFAAGGIVAAPRHDFRPVFGDPQTVCAFQEVVVIVDRNPDRR